MLQGWNFLIAEILLLLIVAMIAGLIAGWLLFGGRQKRQSAGGLEAELNACRAEVATLRVELGNAQARTETPIAPAPKPAPVKKTASPLKQKKPRTMKAARKGEPDDLKIIKGIGPELEKLCHRLGFFHYDQIAKWTKEEIAWVDENLEGFKGRVTRDKWVAQAKKLTSAS